jgi:hypothetical protein
MMWIYSTPSQKISLFCGIEVGSAQGETYNFKGVRDDPNGHKLLAVVSAVHHQ